MKLTAVKRKGNICGYTIFINKAEAESSGLIDREGESFDLVKEVDAKKQHISVKRTGDKPMRKAVSSGYLYDNMDRLRSGEEIKTARNDHYKLVGNILHKQRHQPYLRGEPLIPYAELVGGVFYHLNSKEMTDNFLLL